MKKTNILLSLLFLFLNAPAQCEDLKPQRLLVDGDREDLHDDDGDHHDDDGDDDHRRRHHHDDDDDNDDDLWYDL